MAKSQIQIALDKINDEINLRIAVRDRLLEAQRTRPTRKARSPRAETARAGAVNTGS